MHSIAQIITLKGSCDLLLNKCTSFIEQNMAGLKETAKYIFCNWF